MSYTFELAPGLLAGGGVGTIQDLGEVDRGHLEFPLPFVVTEE